MTNGAALPILLVERDEALRAAVAAALRSDGHRVVVRDSFGGTFSDVVEGRYALLIADDHLVERSGLEILERQRAAGASAPTILIADGPAPEALVVRARRARVALVTRPVDAEALARLVRCVLSKRGPERPRLSCAACGSTKDLSPPSVDGFVFFCDECLRIADASPDDPMVDIGGPGGR